MTHERFSIALLPLIGRRIDAAREVHDYLQLVFDDGSVLNVFNGYSAEGAGDIGVHALVGRCVTAVMVEAQRLQLEASAFRLRIDLSAKAFHGPEAVEYIPVSGSRIVW